ncbi:hypothetical protein ACFSKW_54575 [Nonomuraea mangrovi]|uniref:Uncharacterized protein n=1 Tax=Nonomuraea mangrovi TaxID=2316207 RepID=A0ABW4TFJ5_9ACTN
MILKALRRLSWRRPGIYLIIFAAACGVAATLSLTFLLGVPFWLAMGVNVVLSLAGGWYGGAVDERFARKRLIEANMDPGIRLRRRVDRVNAAFAEAVTLMDELDRDLKAQQAAREMLISEAERQQRLLNLNREQAEQIRKILLGETEATIRADRRQQWLFFVLGVLVSAATSIPIGIWVNSIS